MHPRIRRTATFLRLVILGTAITVLVSNSIWAQVDDLSRLEGEWIYVEDLTEGRALEQLGPPMSSKFSMRVEDGAVILVRGHGSGHTDVRIALDGSITEFSEPQKISRYRGAWKDGVFSYEVDIERESENASNGLIRRNFRITPDGLVVRAVFDPPEGSESVGLYRHAEDIDMPEPAIAAIEDLAWMVGAWVGTRGSAGTTSIDERWGPPLGGAMFAVSRTVSRDRMSAFEYLRIIERDGGLIYIAQPGGGQPTEFVLTELDTSRAVFDNPRHDYPKRIVYELSTGDSLSATIGFIKGGSPRSFEFKRESR